MQDLESNAIRAINKRDKDPSRLALAPNIVYQIMALRSMAVTIYDPVCLQSPHYSKKEPKGTQTCHLCLLNCRIANATILRKETYIRRRPHLAEDLGAMKLCWSAPISRRSGGKFGVET